MSKCNCRVCAVISELTGSTLEASVGVTVVVDGELKVAGAANATEEVPNGLLRISCLMD